MARPGKIITNPVTGQQIKFLQTAKDTHGRLLEMESRFAPRSLPPAVHYHPYQYETFIVQRGAVHVRLNDKLQVFNAGEIIEIASGTTHAMWNAGEEVAVVNWKVFPALDTEYLLEMGMGLARDGMVNEKGQPNLLQSAVLLRKYQRVYRLAKPSPLVQKILFGVAASLGKLRGYKAVYKAYID